MARSKRFIILGDVHAPWVNTKTVQRFHDHLSSQHFDYVIQIGDLYDLYSASKFARTHDLCTPAEELKEAREWAVNFWKQVKKTQKTASCIQLKGNHDERPVKRILEKAPELFSFFDFKKPWEFDGVTTQPTQATHIEIDGVLFQHGHRTKAGDHMRYNLKSTVIGHSHLGSVTYMNHGRGSLYELNVGFCADTQALPLKYTLNTVLRWTQGYGVIDEYGPRFIAV